MWMRSSSDRYRKSAKDAMLAATLSGRHAGELNCARRRKLDETQASETIWYARSAHRCGRRAQKATKSGEIDSL